MIKINMLTKSLLIVTSMLLMQSCVSKKDILYLQDADVNASKKIQYQERKIQPNDILSVTIGALVGETAIPYNKPVINNKSSNTNNIQVLKLKGYLVSTEGTIQLPVLGEVVVVNKTTSKLQKELKFLLKTGNHLINPTVSVRLLNAKVTVLGEVKSPGTFTFTEHSISLLQALGYAGDLDINGKRKDVLLIREVDGIRNVLHVNLTKTDWMDDSRYTIKPNDVIVVNPNSAKIKSAGYVGKASTIVAIGSLLVSSLILLTRR